jgi:hypothetical protein
MRRASLRLLLIAALAGAGLVLGALGAGLRWDARLSNLLLFAAWLAAMLLLLALALHLPARIAGPRYRAALWNGLLAAAAIVITYAANVAVFRHDVHLDLSREGVNTPPPALESVVEGLKSDIRLTYFYNNADDNAVGARELLAIAARQNAHFQFRAVDLDKEPATARRLGVRAYNTAVLEAEDRRLVVENTVDLGQIAYAALRVLKQRVDVICFVTGHGEPFSPAPPHFHYSHVETLKGHDVPGSGDILVGPPDGLDRLQLALTTLGYVTRPVVPATLPAIAPDCAVVAEIGPRSGFAPGEARLLSNYLAGGGRLLLMIDPAFPVEPELAGLLGRLGLAADPAVVIDPLNHSGSDATKVAVPYYPPHPITDRVAMTIFPEARPIRLGSAPAGIAADVVVASSSDSYLRSLPEATEGGQPTLPDAAEASPSRRNPAVLAVAVQGRWPDAPAGQGKPFRLVLVGNSNFATNAYFPSVSNGDLAVGIIRWLAGDEAMPRVKPQSFSQEQIELTSRQMRGIFVLVELVLPLSVIAFGGIVWWRRR